jgi:hypothetical protein
MHFINTISIPLTAGGSVTTITSTHVFRNSWFKRIQIFRGRGRVRSRPLLLCKPEVLDHTPAELLHQLVQKHVDSVACTQTLVHFV